MVVEELRDGEGQLSRLEVRVVCCYLRVDFLGGSGDGFEHGVGAESVEVGTGVSEWEGIGDGFQRELGMEGKSVVTSARSARLEDNNHGD